MSKAVSHTLPITGSGTLLSGTPSVVSYYEELIDNFPSILSTAAEKASNRYQESLRGIAQRKGWGTQSGEINVDYNKSNMEFVVTGSQDLEYGRDGDPPKPVVRNAITRTTDLEDLVEEELGKVTQKRKAL